MLLQNISLMKHRPLGEAGPGGGGRVLSYYVPLAGLELDMLISDVLNLTRVYLYLPLK